MPETNVTFQLIMLDNGALGYLVRTVRTESGHAYLYLMSRKTGLWISLTAQELIEHDIPSECLLPVGELPQTLQIAPSGNVGSGKPFTTPQGASGAG